jgi:hypothetical protein
LNRSKRREEAKAIKANKQLEKKKKGQITEKKRKENDDDLNPT